MSSDLSAPLLPTLQHCPLHPEESLAPRRHRPPAPYIAPQLWPPCCLPTHRSLQGLSSGPPRPTLPAAALSLKVPRPLSVLQIPFFTAAPPPPPEPSDLWAGLWPCSLLRPLPSSTTRSSWHLSVPVCAALLRGRRPDASAAFAKLPPSTHTSLVSRPAERTSSRTVTSEHLSAPGARSSVLRGQMVLSSAPPRTVPIPVTPRGHHPFPGLKASPGACSPR